MNKLLEPFVKSLTVSGAYMALGIESVIMLAATGRELPDRVAIDVRLAEGLDPPAIVYVNRASEAPGKVNEDYEVTMTVEGVMVLRGRQYMIMLPERLTKRADSLTVDKVAYRFVDAPNATFQIEIWAEGYRTP